MYKSLKKWLTVPIQLKPFLSYDGAGDKTYSAAQNIFCYVEGKAVVVIDITGVEVTSRKQVYLDGSVAIKATDSIVLEGKELVIKAIAPFYDGNNGLVDVWVVYL